MKIVINDIPPSDNTYKGRKNVWQYRSDKAWWTHELQILALYAKPINYKPPQKANVTVTYFFKTKARRDPDNYSGKFLLDGLTKAGVIMDDCFDRINLILKGDYDKENPRTEIEIEEVEG